MKSGHHIYIGLGTNIGDRAKNLSNAIAQIETRIGKYSGKSSIYKSPPFGFQADTDFFNQVIAIDSELEPLVLLKELKLVEKEMGRIKTKASGYESRIIDLDIIDYKGRVFQFDDLSIPHAQMHLRDFVLLPLADVAPEWIHPVLGQSVSQLIAELGTSKKAEKMDIVID